MTTFAFVRYHVCRRGRLWAKPCPGITRDGNTYDFVRWQEVEGPINVSTITWMGELVMQSGFTCYEMSPLTGEEGPCESL